LSKKFLVCSVLMLALCFSYPSFAGTGTQVEELAKKYVLAVESGDYEQGMQFATGAAVSWVEYMKADSFHNTFKIPAFGKPYDSHT
jgi:hypothetical protein